MLSTHVDKTVIVIWCDRCARMDVKVECVYKGCLYKPCSPHMYSSFCSHLSWPCVRMCLWVSSYICVHWVKTCPENNCKQYYTYSTSLQWDQKDDNNNTIKICTHAHCYDDRNKGWYIFASGVISKMHNKIHGRQIRSRLWGLHLPSRPIDNVYSTCLYCGYTCSLRNVMHKNLFTTMLIHV